MPKAIGIDLGTTFSLVAVCDGAGARILGGTDGERLVPSVVSMAPGGRIVVGSPARARAAADPANTVFSI